MAGTWLAFLGYPWTPRIVTVLALGELITDQLPTTPSRKVPAQFGARVPIHPTVSELIPTLLNEMKPAQ